MFVCGCIKVCSSMDEICYVGQISGFGFLALERNRGEVKNHKIVLNVNLLLLFFDWLSPTVQIQKVINHGSFQRLIGYVLGFYHEVCTIIRNRVVAVNGLKFNSKILYFSSCFLQFHFLFLPFNATQSPKQIRDRLW